MSGPHSVTGADDGSGSEISVTECGPERTALGGSLLLESSKQEQLRLA